jgi:hypothetical protein
MLWRETRTDSLSGGTKCCQGREERTLWKNSLEKVKARHVLPGDTRTGSLGFYICSVSRCKREGAMHEHSTAECADQPLRLRNNTCRRTESCGEDALLIANALVDQDTTTRTRSKTWDRRAERIFSTLSPAVRFGQ